MGKIDQTFSVCMVQCKISLLKLFIFLTIIGVEWAFVDMFTF